MIKFEKISIKEQEKAIKKLNSLFVSNLFVDKILNYINSKEFKLPERKTGCSAGYDFTLPISLSIKPKSMVIIPTFVKIKLDEDKFLSIYPRSSYGIKKGIVLANTVGIIDADYYNNLDNEGHILIAIKNTSESEIIELNQGDTFAQGIIQKFFLVEKDNYGIGKSRSGGIGSTGK